MRNLLGRLHDRSPQSLAKIAWFWEVDLQSRDPRRDTGQLYRVLTDPWSFALVWERLSPAERQLVETLSEAGNALTIPEIAEQLGVEKADAEGIARRLYDAGLLFVEQPDSDERALGSTVASRLFVSREAALLTARFREERGRGMPGGETAQELLDRLDDGALAEIAEAMGHQVIPAVAVRADLLAAVGPALTDPDRIQDAVRSLDAVAGRLWRWLNEAGGTAPPHAAQDALGLRTAPFRRAITVLARQGLLWRGYEADGSLRLVIPGRILHPERPLQPPPPEFRPVLEADVEPVDWVHAHAAAWDLLTILRAAANGSIRARQGDLDSSVPAVRRLVPMLWRRSGDVSPTGYLPFLAYLGTGLGLLDADVGGVVTESLRSWTRLDFPEQTRRMLALWRGAAEWPEGASREALQVWGADWQGFRDRLLRTLGTLEPGSWLTLGSFVDRFAAIESDAMGTHFTAAAGRNGSDESPAARRQSVLRLAAEITIVTGCAWFGLVGISRARRETVISLTDLGASLLSAEPSLPEEPELGAHPLAVQPSFEVLLLRPAPRRVWALSAFTELATLDRVSIYRITRRGIEGGLGAGLSVGQMVRFLEEESQEPLPQTVGYEIAEWARQYRRVRLRSTLLLEPDERSATDDLEAALKMADIRVERLPDDRLLVLLPADERADAIVRKVEKVLRDRGQTPQWHGGKRPG